MNEESLDVRENQRNFMALIEEYFSMVTGASISNFQDTDHLTDALRASAHKSAACLKKATEWLIPNLHEFYSKYGTEHFPAARNFPGIKPVLGGSSRFTLSSLKSIQQIFLYSDTILIPDPILPWIEVERTEERFRSIHILNTIYHLLHLKPFVDLEDLEYPPVFIFPSWEKSLEARDTETKEQFILLMVSVIANELDIPFESIEDITAFASKHPDDFLSKVEDCQLFVSPGGSIGESISTAIKSYREGIELWRSNEHKTRIMSLPDSLLVLHGIQERIMPQMHLIENADELNASPFTSLPVQWHYYNKCNSLFSQRLSNTGVLSERTVAEINALRRNEFSWLSNVSIEYLAQLRKAQENVTFRRRIREFTEALHEATFDDVDRVALEVAQGLNSLITEHKETMKVIENKYTIRTGNTLLIAAASACVVMAPTLAPLLGSTPLLYPLAKLTSDYFSELREEKAASRSLMGILSAAKNG